MTSPVLEATDVTAGYGDATVLRDVSVSLGADEIVSIIGPNGAGKTTLLGVLVGLVSPDRGTVRLHGEAVTDRGTNERVARGVSLVSEERNLFRDMTVRENLVLGAYCDREDRDEQLARVYDLFPRLAERADQSAGTLSGGEAQMLAIGRGLMVRPDVLLLDEPTLGLAPALVPELFETVSRINDAGVAVLLVEQRAERALATADTGYLLENGRIAHRGDADAMLADESLVETYLGGGA